MRDNRQLVLDISSLYNYPNRRIHRKSQKIHPVVTKFKNLPGSLKGVIDAQVFNYTLAPLQDFMLEEASGVIVIFEDASAIEELNSKLKDMQTQLNELTNNPIKTETSLQRCIEKLTSITDQADVSSRVTGQLTDVINILKKGNLNRAEISILDKSENLDAELVSYLSEYVETSETDDKRNSIYNLYSKSFDVYDESEELGVRVEELRNWSLDAFSIDDHFEYILAMLQDFKLTQRFRIKIPKLRIFVSKVKENYELWANPFHNFYHGFTVMHSNYYLLATTKASIVYCEHEILAQLVASLCHDVGHTGHNNAYEINRSSSYAIVYNDKSVLENHHAALTFQILQNDSCNIFDNLLPDVYKSVRKLMIECILATDMSKHFNCISSMNTRFNDLEDHPIRSLEDDCEKTASLIIHLADLGHPTKDFGVFSNWSLLVCQEFSKQYEDEVKFGLPATDFMRGLDDPSSYYKNEVAFINVIIKPLWECANNWLKPDIDHCMLNLDNNAKKFQEKLQEITTKT